MATRTEDHFVLDVLRLRRDHTPSYISRKFNISKPRVKEICDEIMRADLSVSTRKNVEKISDIVLHYPRA
jgi:hypothetical protein